MSEHTATVEVLTAEVRVLMVGSRQVTLSVVRQLDEAEPEEVRPFGRIRSDRKPDSNDIEVVGSADGTLVRSRAIKFWERCIDGAGHCCPDRRAEREAHFAALRAVEGDRDRYDALPMLSRHRHHDYISGYYPDKHTYDSWAGMPLIVLAGLR